MYNNKKASTTFIISAVIVIASLLTLSWYIIDKTNFFIFNTDKIEKPDYKQIIHQKDSIILERENEIEEKESQISILVKKTTLEKEELEDSIGSLLSDISSLKWKLHITKSDTISN